MQTPSSCQVIFTASPEFAQAALNEIQQVDRGSKLLQWLDQGVGLIQLDALNFRNLAPRILETKAAFVRHLCPVNDKIPFEITHLGAAIAAQISLFDRAETLSIQIRSSTKNINRFELRNALIDVLTNAGLKVAAKDPTQIISIFCDSTTAYLGFSNASENLSNWAGGMHRFAQEDDQISRAEFKLLEAIDVFNLNLPIAGLALDLGASPGGWTRVLRKLGLSVVAVDPGDLAESLQSDRNVMHHRQLVQQYLPNCRDRFDLIVNDMRMDAVDSAKNMIAARKTLKENGIALMTLKLPSKGVKSVIANAIIILEKEYEVIGIRNLFHNRQEVTLAMRSSGLE